MKVYIPQDIDIAGKRYLTDRGYQLKIGTSTAEDVMKKEIADCDGVIIRVAKLPASVIEAAPKLRVIARHGVGTDNIDIAAATRLGIRVTNGPYSNSESVAEHTVAFIMALAHQLVKLDSGVREGDWDIRNRIRLTEMHGKTVGLIGCGRIGRAVARRLALGLDMKVLTYGTRHPEKLPDYVELTGSLEELLQRSDFVSIHCPSTPETKGLITMKYLSMMKKDAFLVNTARGDVINEQDLYQALTEGMIKGAALDVLSEEPASCGHPLLSLPNVIFTPHCASHTNESFANMAVHAAMGVDEVLSGKTISWPVN